MANTVRYFRDSLTVDQNLIYSLGAQPGDTDRAISSTFTPAKHAKHATASPSGSPNVVHSAPPVEEQHQTPISRRMPKKDWRLSEAAFHRLLEWLDEGANSHGEKYLEMRRRLEEYFDRKNCPSAADLADDTLNRVARRLEEAGTIVSTAPARYCYTVAKFVFLETLHKGPSESVSLAALSDHSRDRALISLENSESEHKQTEEKQFRCVEQCLQRLEPDDRELICAYYHGEQRAKIENRHRLAERFALTSNALTIRTCRIRRKLESCVRECTATKENSGPYLLTWIGLFCALEMFWGFSLIIVGTRADA